MAISNSLLGDPYLEWSSLCGDVVSFFRRSRDHDDYWFTLFVVFFVRRFWFIVPGGFYSVFRMYEWEAICAVFGMAFRSIIRYVRQTHSQGFSPYLCLWKRLNLLNIIQPSRWSVTLLRRRGDGDRWGTWMGGAGYFYFDAIVVVDWRSVFRNYVIRSIFWKFAYVLGCS